MMLKTSLLFFATALAEIIGCFFALYLVTQRRQRMAFIPGGVYVMTAMLWLRFVDGVKLSTTDWLGACVALAGMLIIISGWKAA